MRVTPELMRKIKKPRVQYERTYPVPFKAEISITLRDRVSSKVLKPKERPCLPELTSVLQCFKVSDFNETRCSAQLEAFSACMSRHNAAQSALKGDNVANKTIKDLTPQEVTQLLKKNPQL